MKKRVPAYFLVVVILLLIISLWRNHSYATEKEHLRNNMLSTSLSTLVNISTNLDGLIAGLEDNSMSYKDCEVKLVSLSNSFAELHYALTTYATYFPPPGVTRNCYSGHIDFDFISHTLVGGWGELNYNRYHGIMFDNTVSEKEVKYLTELKISVDDMIAAITEKDDQYNQYQLRDISPSYLDKVILDFTERYYIAFDDSPLKLLFE